MGVVNSFSIRVCKCDCLLVRGRPWRSSRELNILHYFQIRLPRLGRLTCWASSYNNSYLSKQGSRRLFYLPFQLLVLMSSSKEIFQLSLSYKIFNLLIQIVTFICVVPIVSMEATILVPIALVGISLHFLRPFQGRIILDLYKDLLKRHVQWRVLLTPCWRTILLTISVYFIFCLSLFWTRGLLGVAHRVCFHSLNFLPLLGYDRVFYIHKVLGWMDEFSHGLRLLLIKLVDEQIRINPTVKGRQW